MQTTSLGRDETCDSRSPPPFFFPLRPPSATGSSGTHSIQERNSSHFTAFQQRKRETAEPGSTRGKTKIKLQDVTCSFLDSRKNTERKTGLRAQGPPLLRWKGARAVLTSAVPTPAPNGRARRTGEEGKLPSSQASDDDSQTQTQPPRSPSPR